ncbi:DUF4233 domain-containing protein [Jatrophihabitans sp.]|uniref:DUF4233 domain-containing protein n=1 Tax=Jatrophihabitans sp. TaxID=1932789 RepID=UPI0030C6DEBF|nr:hypothetical protein [Jatrophihabitans sp.]
MTEPHEPTEDEVAARAARADKASRGALAGTLGLEALVVLLLPRALAATDQGLGLTKTLILVAFALVLIAAAGMLRRPRGIAIGSALQVPLLLTGIWLAVMFIVALVFWAVWYRVLVLRRDVVGTPGGLRMLIS